MLAALTEAREALGLCTTRDFDAPEDEIVRKLGDRIGFGAMMSAASKEWFKKDGVAGGHFTVGPCAGTVERALASLDKAIAEIQQRSE